MGGPASPGRSLRVMRERAREVFYFHISPMQRQKKKKSGGNDLDLVPPLNKA